MKNNIEHQNETVVEQAEGFLKEKNAMSDDEIELPRENYNARPKPAPAPQQLADGSAIKKVREAKGLTLEMIHESTKIPMDSLRAIEEGYTVRTLSPFYYRGFVKIYCQYLDMDMESVMKTITPKKKEPSARLSKAINVDDFDFSSWTKEIFTAKRKRQLIQIAAIALVLFILFKGVGAIGGWISNHAKNRSTAKAVEISKPAEGKKKKAEVMEQARAKAETQRTKNDEGSVEANMVENIPVVTAADTAVEETASAAPPSETVSDKEIKLTVRAKKNSWLRVKNDGQTVFQSTLKQGTVETWNANDNIEISGKNLNQIEVELNGKMIGTLARDNRQANTVVITKKGLSVIK